MTNLNQIGIETHGGSAVKDGREYRQIVEAATGDGCVQVYFEGLQERLIALIETADAVTGCVAWLTSESILRALAKKKVVAIVVQKEDFLRPDVGQRRERSGVWRARLRELYGSLSCCMNRYNFGNVVGSLSVAGDPTLDPVRCAGVYNRDRAAAAPRMHHKFLVFSDIVRPPRDSTGEEEDSWLKPHTVWTGSFNLTQNAVLSLENAVVIRDPAIVAAYYEEWAHIEGLSESLDWKAEWAEPEWRIGT